MYGCAVVLTNILIRGWCPLTSVGSNILPKHRIVAVKLPVFLGGYPTVLGGGTVIGQRHQVVEEGYPIVYDS